MIENLQIRNSEYKSQLEFSHANSDNLEKDIKILKSKISAKQHHQEKLEIYEKERENIKEDLLKLWKFQRENEIYKSSSLSAEYKVSRPIESIEQTANSILAKMVETDSRCGTSAYPSFPNSVHSPLDLKNYSKIDSTEYM